MANKTVPLASTILTHGGALQSVILREPTAAEYWEHGEPTRWAYTRDGVGFQVENEAAIKAYIEACVVEPKDPLMLQQIKSLKDGMAIKRAMLGFFLEAQTANSTTSSNC